MTTINLDERRKAMAEAGETGHDLILGGVTYRLPAAIPLGFIWSLMDYEILKAAEFLVGKDRAAAFLEAGVDMEDMKLIAEAYGAELPNSSVRPISSTSTGPRANRTSRRTTAKTSRKPA